MIQFPETAQAEWQIVADAAQVESRLRERLARDTLIEQRLEKLRIEYQAKALFQQELDAEDTPDLEMITLADYQATPTAAPTPLIEGVLNDDTVMLVLGPGGSGKSTLALQMLYCMMTGNEWLGQPVQQISGAVGALSYDMPGGMMLDWMTGYPNVNPSKVSIVNAHKRGNPLAVPTQRKQIAAAWRAMNVEVVLIDSFSASFFAHDQNDAGATQAHYRDLKKFALTEVGARTLIVIVHSTEGSPKKPRGSTVHHDVADSIVAVWSPHGPTGLRNVEMTKYRAARGQDQMTPRVITAPDAVTHLVDLNLGAMTLEGMHLPPGSAAAAFTDVPDPIAAPDTGSDEEDDDL